MKDSENELVISEDKLIIENYHLYSKKIDSNRDEFLNKNSSGVNYYEENYDHNSFGNSEEKRLLIISKILSSDSYLAEVSLNEFVENKEKKIALLVSTNNDEKWHFNYVKKCLDDIKDIFYDENEIAEKAKYQLIKRVWNYKYGTIKTAYLTKENIWNHFLQIYYLHEIITSNYDGILSWKRIKLAIANYSIKETPCINQMKESCQTCLICDINSMHNSEELGIGEEFACIKKKIKNCSDSLCRKCTRYKDLHLSDYPLLTESLNHNFWYWFENHSKNVIHKKKWQVSSLVIMKRYRDFIFNHSFFLKKFEILNESSLQKELALADNFLNLKIKRKSSVFSISKKVSSRFFRKENFFSDLEDKQTHFSEIVPIFLNIIGIQLDCKIYLGRGLKFLIIENLSENKNLESTLLELSYFVKESTSKKRNEKVNLLIFNTFKNKIDSFKKIRVECWNNSKCDCLHSRFEFSDYQPKIFSFHKPLGKKYILRKEFINCNYEELQRTKITFQKIEYFLFNLVRIFANEQIYKLMNESEQKNFMLSRTKGIDHSIIRRILHLIADQNWKIVNSKSELIELLNLEEIEESVFDVNKKITDYNFSIVKIGEIFKFVRENLDDNNNFISSLIGIDGEEKAIEYYHFLLTKLNDLKKVSSYRSLWDSFIEDRKENDFNNWEELNFDKEDYELIIEDLIFDFDSRIRLNL